MNYIDVWTDGACFPNPGKGGWAWVTRDGRRSSGSEPNTTNNRMEIKAAIEAISDLFIKGSVVRVYSDSQYVVNGATTWVHNWAKHNWGVDRKSPIKNTDLWSELHEIIQSCACQFIWVKGHNGDEMNEAADALANAAAGIGADNNRFYRY